MNDVRLAFRQLRNGPAFTVAALAASEDNLRPVARLTSLACQPEPASVASLIGKASGCQVEMWSSFAKALAALAGYGGQPSHALA